MLGSYAARRRQGGAGSVATIPDVRRIAWRACGTIRGTVRYTTMTSLPHPAVDPERPHSERPFDRAGGYSGEDGNVRDEELMCANAPSGTVAARPQDAGDRPGARASFDPATGATRGSGAGPTEEYDTDDPVTGAGKQGGAEG